MGLTWELSVDYVVKVKVKFPSAQLIKHYAMKEYERVDV
jgi:hypothetical protein